MEDSNGWTNFIKIPIDYRNNCDNHIANSALSWLAVVQLSSLGRGFLDIKVDLKVEKCLFNCLSNASAISANYKKISQPSNYWEYRPLDNSPHKSLFKIFILLYMSIQYLQVHFNNINGINITGIPRPSCSKQYKYFTRCERRFWKTFCFSLWSKSML